MEIIRKIYSTPTNADHAGPNDSPDIMAVFTVRVQNDGTAMYFVEVRKIINSYMGGAMFIGNSLWRLSEDFEPDELIERINAYKCIDEIIQDSIIDWPRNMPFNWSLYHQIVNKTTTCPCCGKPIQ